MPGRSQTRNTAPALERVFKALKHPITQEVLIPLATEAFNYGVQQLADKSNNRQRKQPKPLPMHRQPLADMRNNVRSDPRYHAKVAFQQLDKHFDRLDRINQIADKYDRRDARYKHAHDQANWHDVLNAVDKHTNGYYEQRIASYRNQLWQQQHAGSIPLGLFHMSLLAITISRGPIILCDYSTEDGEGYGAAMQTILSRIPPNASKLSYSADEHLFHYNQNLTFLCMADDSMGRRTPFAFLADLQKEFLAAFSREEISDAPPYGFGGFSSKIKALMNKYETSPPNDAIRNAQAEVQNVKDVMVKNVENILSRGERLDLLINKTDDLSTQAHAFRKRSAAVRRQMWWKNTRLMALSGFTIVTILYLVMASACGIGLNHCVS